MQDKFIIENPELHDYPCNQNTLIKEGHFKYLEGHRNLLQKPGKTPLRTTWYPYVNSYYQYGEDYDAVNRLSHLLHECDSKDVSSDVEDQKDGYTEKGAFMNYLRSKPTSFIILGKPDVGEQKLGKILANYWKSVYIHPEELISEEIESGSRAGVCIEYNLRCGRAVSIDIVLRLLEKRMKTQSVVHRGFVLCGFPLVSNKLFTDDPVSSESAVFNVRDIFDEVFESAFDLIAKEAAKNVSRTSKVNSVDEEEEEDKENEEKDAHKSTYVQIPTKKAQSKTNVLDLGIATGKICYESYYHSNHIDQMEFVLNLCESSKYVIVYLKCTNEEVINVRSNNRIDARTLELLNKLRDRTDDVNTYDLYPHADEIDNGFIDNRKLLKLQRDFPAQVKAQLERYRYESQTVIEKCILLHDPEYVIKLDGRTAPHRMFHALKARIRVLPISQSLIPQPLNDWYGVDMGEGASASPRINYDEKTPEEWFANLHTKQTLGPLYKWSLSDWQYSCPVAMYNGRNINGDPNLAVHFVNKIFFLSDDDAYINFIRNPRPYLLSPYPKTPCKIYIMGPKKSGKSTIAQLLHYTLGAEIMDPDTITKAYHTSQYDEFMRHMSSEAINEATAILKTKRRQEFEHQERVRLAKVDMFLNEMRTVLKEYLHSLDVVGEYVGREITSMPSPQSVMKSYQVLECEKAIVSAYNILRATTFPVNDKDALSLISKSDKLILEYLPKELHPPLEYQFQLISKDHKFVQEYLNKAMRKAKHMFDSKILSTDILDCFKKAIDHFYDNLAERDNNGWIFDGFPMNADLIKSLEPKYMADIIYLLRDTTPNCQFLKEKEAEESSTPMHNLLLEAGYEEAAAMVKDNFGLNKNMTYLKLPEELVKEPSQEDEKHYTQYDKNREAMVTYMEANQISYADIVFTNKTIKKLLEEVFRNIQSRHTQHATRFTAEDRVKEIEDYGEHTEDEEVAGEGIEGNIKKDNFFAENRRFGLTKDYCPVTLAQHGVLWKGKEQYAAKYLNELYFLSSEEALNEFISCAFENLTLFKDSPIRTLPPPRICIVGIPNIGKTTVAKMLSREFGLYHKDFGMLLRQLLDDEALEAYLTRDQPIPANILKDILLPYWFDDTTGTTGFVLDGFPSRPSDLDFMCAHTAIPDVIIELTCPNHILFARILENVLQEWQIQADAKKAIEEAALESLLDKWQSARNARRRRLLSDKRNARYDMKLQHKEEEDSPRIENELETESMISYRSVEEAEDLQEIEALLDEELPEPHMEGHWETKEMAKERLQAEIEADHSGDEFIDLLHEHCDAEQIPWIQVGAADDAIKVYNQVALKVAYVKQRSQSIFERVYDISVEMAEKLLEQGYFFLSRFGKSCPVQIYENHNHLQLLLPCEAKFQLYPQIHKRYIYFIAGSESRIKFKENILKYVMQERSYLPMQQMRVAVIGPPRCGKTIISERIQYTYGLQHISIGKAVRYVLKYLSSSKLAEKVENLLRQGECLGDDLTMLCVEAMSYNSRSVALGFIMDGFPNNVTEIRELAKLNLVPHLIIDLRTGIDYILLYMTVFEASHKPQYSKAFIGHRYTVWYNYAEYFRQWVCGEFQNLAEVPIDPSKWKFWRNTEELLLAVTSEIKYYYTHKDKDRPLRIGNLLVTPMEFSNRSSLFKSYCPCCLFYTNTLSCGGNPPDRTGLLQYEDKYYWLCADHIEEFIDGATLFLGPNVKHTLPITLPIVSSTCPDPEACHADGNCVVCIYELSQLIPGRSEYAVQYGVKFYLFDKVACLNKFISASAKYSGLTLNFKSPTYASVEPKDLPTLGFLEQFDAQQVVKAVLDTSNKRPVITGLDAKASALVHLGLFLKVKNPNTPADKVALYAEALERVTAKQTALMESLKEMKKTINPYIHYEEPLREPMILTEQNMEESRLTTSVVYLLSNEISTDFTSFASTATSEETIVQNVVDEMLDKIASKPL